MVSFLRTQADLKSMQRPFALVGVIYYCNSKKGEGICKMKLGMKSSWHSEVRGSRHYGQNSLLWKSSLHRIEAFKELPDVHSTLHKINPISQILPKLCYLFSSEPFPPVT